MWTDLDMQAGVSTFVHMGSLAMQEGAGGRKGKGWSADPQLLSSPRLCRCYRWTC